MLAARIEAVGVHAGLVRLLEPFAQLQIEDAKTQPACGFAIRIGIRQPQPVAAGLGMNAPPLRGRVLMSANRFRHREGTGGALKGVILPRECDHADSMS
jgi:hypothetical protein